MEKYIQTPKFGDFLLSNGQYVSEPANPQEVSGIYLYDGISFITFSPKKKMFFKARNWCNEHGGTIPSVQTLFFIRFHLEEINRLRQKVNLRPLPPDLLVWAGEGLKNRNFTSISYTVDFATGRIVSKIAECVQIDDCGMANTICVYGETI